MTKRWKQPHETWRASAPAKFSFPDAYMRLRLVFSKHPTCVCQSTSAKTLATLQANSTSSESCGTAGKNRKQSCKQDARHGTYTHGHTKTCVRNDSKRVPLETKKVIETSAQSFCLAEESRRPHGRRKTNDGLDSPGYYRGAPFPTFRRLQAPNKRTTRLFTGPFRSPLPS